MKNKIALKLTLYFTIALLLFAIIISCIFILLFRKSTIDVHKIELEQRAVKISETFITFASDYNLKGQGGMGGYGVYIRLLNDMAMSDVWIVDENLNVITKRQDADSQYSISELPSNAEEIVKEVFNGTTSFSESFSSLLDTPTLTVGTPIKSSDGEVIGVVLLHSPVTGIDLSVSNGFVILILSIGIALVIAIALSIGFSFTFTKPLNRMNNTAIKLADGDYTIKTNIKQNDEIGELAKNLDILTNRLDISTKQSEKLEQMRRDFVANISHELRTPITVVRGSLEALLDGIVIEPAKVSEYYNQMLNESKHLQRLVGDLLDLSSLQNMDFNIEMSDVNLCNIVDDAIRSAKNIANSKNIEFVIYKNANHCIVLSDYGRLRQMFMIILDNAVKFSDQNGHIYITLSQNENFYISIRDEGIGIDDEDLPYIFDRFYKTKSADNSTGTGLGLAISKQIALRLNVQISVISNKGEGSEFIIKF